MLKASRRAIDTSRILVAASRKLIDDCRRSNAEMELQMSRWKCLPRIERRSSNQKASRFSLFAQPHSDTKPRKESPQLTHSWNVRHEE
jgi:hypothetical protein